MHFGVFMTLKRGFAKGAQFSWTKKIHELISENSKVTPNDVFCLWNPGNIKMINQIMSESNSPLCVMQCPTSIVKKSIEKNKDLLASRHFKLIEHESSKRALANLKAFMPLSVVPERVIMFSLRMELGAFWHICLRALLHNHSTMRLHGNSSEPSNLDSPSLDWLHMYLLLNQTEYTALTNPYDVSPANESLSKFVLHPLFTHQTIFQKKDFLGNELSLVRFKVNWRKFGFGLGGGKGAKQAGVDGKEKDEDGALLDRVMYGLGEKGDKKLVWDVWENGAGLVDQSGSEVGEAMRNREPKGLENELLGTESIELQDDDESINELEGGIEKMEDFDGMVEDEDIEIVDGVMDEAVIMDEFKMSNVVNDPAALERLRVLMLLKDLERKCRNRVVPHFDSECKGIGLDLIQKGRFRMTDRMVDVPWEGWLKLVQIAVSHSSYEGSRLSVVMRDASDALNHIPDYYSRKSFTRKFHSI